MRLKSLICSQNPGGVWILRVYSYHGDMFMVMFNGNESHGDFSISSFFWGEVSRSVCHHQKNALHLEHFDIDTPKNYPKISVYERSAILPFPTHYIYICSTYIYIYAVHIYGMWGQVLFGSQRENNAVESRKRPFHLMAFNKNTSLSPDFRILSWIPRTTRWAPLPVNYKWSYNPYKWP